jgi:hypothetical protein
MIPARPYTKSMIAVMMGLIIYSPIFIRRSKHGKAKAARRFFFFV